MQVDYMPISSVIRVTVDLRALPIEDRLALFTTEMERLGITSALLRATESGTPPLDAIEEQLNEVRKQHKVG